MRLFPAMLCLTGFAAAADGPPENVLLQRARVHMARTLSSLPNYTCLQTIERSQRLAPNRKPRLLDMVRIEVALVNGRELFSWPGSGTFQDTEISDMVHGGAIGNGSFALHAKAVFEGGSPIFTYAGEVYRNERRNHKWTFAVPLHRSGYTLRAGAEEAIVAYRGAIWIDAETLDATRLEVHADDIPPRLRMASATDAVEYARARIGSEDFLLPSLSELQMVDTGGSESMNRTKFSACRQYSGESKLVFEDPLSDASTATEPVRNVDAPPGIEVDFAIESPVNLREAAVGDPVTGALKKALKLPGGLILPRGALVHGRLTHLRPAQWATWPGFAVGLRFFEIESGNTHVRFNAALESILTTSPGYLSRPPMPGRLSSVRVENETIYGSIFFVRDHMAQLQRGLRMIWRTAPLQSEDKQ